MRRAARQRLLLFAVVLVLVALAGWQWRRDRADAPGSLAGLSPAAVSRVELTMPGYPTERYTRRDGRWLADDGRGADDGRLDELTAIADAPVAGWRPLADFDPARIGLARPVAVLRLDDVTLRFGDISATGPLRYVQVGDRVALVPVDRTPRPGRREAVPIH